MNACMCSAIGILMLAGCGTTGAGPGEPSHSPRPAEAPTRTGLREVFPHVRLDVSGRVVEFDGRVSPMLVPDARAPRFYLELLACAPDTREHESFIVTEARPSHIHAALLSIGLTPGRPGTIRAGAAGVEVEHPTGDRLDVRIVLPGGSAGAKLDPLEWIVNARPDGPNFVQEERTWAKANGAGPPGWVFAGSRFASREGREVYDADGTGVVIGLTTFGSEVIAWSRAISPDSTLNPPEWVADFGRTPRAGEDAVVRVTPAR